MARIECFMVERTELARESLRRFVFSTKAKCSGPYRYHNAEVVIAEAAPFDSEYDGAHLQPSYELRGDTRWPKSCTCGYEFTDADEWQHHFERLWRTPDGGLFTKRELPPGSMYWLDARFLAVSYEVPGGQCLCVKLPDGVDWWIDGEANNAPRGQPGWQRSGTPPKVTANPSILTSRYHGWLRDGFLEEC